MFLDVVLLATAFSFGFAFLRCDLPPLLGFLAAGFVLKAFGYGTTEDLRAVANSGVTILLFSIGLKLKLKSLLRPQVWGVGLLHMIVITSVICLMVLLLSTFYAPARGLSFAGYVIIGFALSFSSTVFAVKALEERSELGSRHGRISIGILIVQDIAAVIFLGVSKGKVPSPWSLMLLALIPGRFFLLRLMDMFGHGEMLVLFGIIMGLGGARVFEEVNIKGDLGALIVGVLLGEHPRSSELVHILAPFKDLFLVGFFLTIGLESGSPTLLSVAAAAIITLLIPVKSFLFLSLLTAFRLRLRTAVFCALNLGTFSEFGLIVASVALSSGLIGPEWLTIVALAVSFSFLIASPTTHYDNFLAEATQPCLKHLERKKRLKEDLPIDIGDSSVLIFGMGRLGRSIYDDLVAKHPEIGVLGVDFDLEKVEGNIKAGRNVVEGDATDHDFWMRMRENHPDQVRLLILTLPNHRENIEISDRLRVEGFTGITLATAYYPDEKAELEEAGFDAVFDISAQAGVGLAERVFDIVAYMGEEGTKLRGRISRVSRPSLLQRTVSAFHLQRNASEGPGDELEESFVREERLKGAAARFAVNRTKSTVDLLADARLPSNFSDEASNVSRGGSEPQYPRRPGPSPLGKGYEVRRGDLDGSLQGSTRNSFHEWAHGKEQSHSPEQSRSPHQHSPRLQRKDTNTPTLAPIDARLQKASAQLDGDVYMPRVKGSAAPTTGRTLPPLADDEEEFYDDEETPPYSSGGLDDSLGSAELMDLFDEDEDSSRNHESRGDSSESAGHMLPLASFAPR